MEKIKDFGVYTAKRFLVALLLYSVFVAVVLIPSFSRKDSVMVFFICFVAGVLLTAIPVLPFFIAGGMENKKRIEDALKWAEANPAAGSGYDTLDYDFTFKDYYEANKFLFFRKPISFMTMSFGTGLLLWNLMYVGPEPDLPALVLVTILLLYITYPFLILRFRCLLNYNRQKDMFGKRTIEITPDSFKTISPTNENTYKQFLEIHVKKGLLVIYDSPIGIIVLPDRVFKDEGQKNYFIARAYQLVK